MIVVNIFQTRFKNKQCAYRPVSEHIVNNDKLVKSLLRAKLSNLGNKPKMLIERTKPTFYESINYQQQRRTT